MVGDEPHAPYDRPATWFGENDIGLHLDKSVGSIDRRNKRAVLADGQGLPYGKLLLATGSAINRLTIPGAELDGVWPLRTPQHADAIARWFRSGQKVVVIGAGVIGLEVAAAAVELGCVVHVREMAPHAMARSLPLAASDVLVSEHCRRGVDIRFGVGVTALEGRDTVSAVRLQGREVIECNVVVSGREPN